jgi:hypothetical protein
MIMAKIQRDRAEAAEVAARRRAEDEQRERDYLVMDAAEVMARAARSWAEGCSPRRAVWQNVAQALMDAGYLRRPAERSPHDPLNDPLNDR